ncbi:hypothetical protein K466DRAFT_239100 [Polyporus arcularius HHB13444]|uniref:Fungal-type protein kinase domain-containing protein n=1 Tax=Polyporus arcularius HHB13444 TaxID=1314778 RepID=A0A5C3P3H5_9APHY|nr:hypothetical protein K466DRAFT_239100 [Polyporus arcularius HHB13444]
MVVDVCLRPSDFLNAFLPLPPEGPTRPKPSGVNFDNVTGFKTAKDLAERWVDCVNRVRSLCSGYVICLSQESWDPTSRKEDKIDGAIYLRRKHPIDGRPHWGRQRALVEFTNGCISDDPYGDGEYQAQTRLAVAAYAAHAFTRQQRTANFTFFVIRTKARVVRWERAGPTFTEAFDYVDNPKLMCEFLWRFSMLSEEDIGLDFSAKLLGKRHRWYKLMDEIAQGPLKGQSEDIPADEGTITPIPPDSSSRPLPLGAFTYVRERFAASLRDEDWPRYRVAVPTDRPGHFKYFLIGKPDIHASGIVGEGIRGYVAVDVDTKRFVWMKDTWRPYYVDVEAEGDILRRLNEVHVPNIPTLICAGDIRQETQMGYHWELDCRTQHGGETGQETRASKRDHSGAPKRDGIGKNGGQSSPPRHLSHYRLVVNEICLPFKDFKTSRQLIQVVSDCVEAHEGAVTETRLLHRNVSISNVLICPAFVEEDCRAVVKWMGLLTNWEQSKPIPKDGDVDRARQPGREANLFSSVALQHWKWLHADIEDDIESFFRIIIYAGVRYLRSNIRSEPRGILRARAFILDHFSRCKCEEETTRSCSIKLNVMSTGDLSYGLRSLHFDRDGRSWQPTGHPLDTVVDSMLPLFKARYATLEYDRQLFRWYGKCKKTRTRRSSNKPVPPANLPQSIYDSAVQLETHAYFKNLLKRLLEGADWPTEDYVGDVFVARDDDDWDDDDAETTCSSNDDHADRDTKDDGDDNPEIKRLKAIAHYYK